jgi:hypothetical protein
VSALPTDINTSDSGGSGGFWKTAHKFAKFASNRWLRNNPVRLLGLELAGVYIFVLDLASLNLEKGTLHVAGLSLGLLTARLIYWIQNQYRPALHIKEYWDQIEAIQHTNISAEEKEKRSLKVLDQTLEHVAQRLRQSEKERQSLQ